MPYLEWTNKAKAVADVSDVPYHLLSFERGYGDSNADNLLIRGDNLLALKALLPFYRGRVKCIYIDPPYNTQSAFEHYDDRLEHSQWLSMMYPRLVLLRELLAANGSIWVSIDDNEAHYLKVLCDDIFGRKNFVGHVIWQKKFAPQNDTKLIDANHDHILCFSKNIALCQLNLLQRSDKMNDRYKNPDNDPRGPWTSDNPLRREYREYAYYEIETPFGRKVIPPPGSSWRFNKEDVPKLIADNRLYFGKDGKGVPRIKRFLSEVKIGIIPQTIWLHTEAGNTQEAKKEVIALNSKEIFDTPKPERLLTRILQIATNPNDLVLDSFLGSGTTAAVAHKMGRRYIGIEMGEHAETHCIPRLQKVIAGEQGGISQAVNWQGGGGFRYYTLADPVFLADGSINPAVRFPALAAYLWHFDTEQAASQTFDSPFLGEHNGKAYYLLYNGILGDRTPQGGNVLTAAVLAHLLKVHPHPGPKVIYGVMTRLGTKRLAAENIEFKQIPYDVRVR
ncbi:MAG: site-specific DNA-methyltransferase [Synechococcaceae cyanobacterium SM1_2_3]|nr:site-specific DNA-methyltransferase [Synechococcaceae cyanobacterium SM1_2_3]